MDFEARDDSPKHIQELKAEIQRLQEELELKNGENQKLRDRNRILETRNKTLEQELASTKDFAADNRQESSIASTMLGSLAWVAGVSSTSDEDKGRMAETSQMQSFSTQVAQWKTVSGYIIGEKVHSEKMTIKEAKVKCKDLPGCVGFYYSGSANEATDEAICITFGSSSDVREGWQTYTSCFLLEAEKDEEDRLACEEVKMIDEGMKQDVGIPLSPTPVSPPPVLMPTVFEELSVGSWVDVYSNSCQTWCPGIVSDVDEFSYFVAYQVPGELSASNVNMNTKTLPKDSSEIRGAGDNGPWSQATVEVVVLDDARQKTAVTGRISDFSGGVATIKDLACEKIITILPSEDKHISLPGTENAMMHRQSNLMEGSLVEVYSHTMGCWCHGVVQRINPGEEGEGDRSAPSVIVAFSHSDMDPQNEEPEMIELPMDHADLRVSNTPAPSENPVKAADLLIGASIEVYSESRGAWLLGLVKSLSQDTVVMLLKYPDMPEHNNVFEKELPIGHAYMRLPTAKYLQHVTMGKPWVRQS